VDVQIVVYSVLSFISQSCVPLIPSVDATGGYPGAELLTHAEAEVLPQVDVLVLRVVIKHILLDFVTDIAQSIFFIKVLEVVSNDRV